MTMEESKTYNGWTNYETWCVNLWMDENRGHYAELAQETWERSEADSYFTRDARATLNLSDALKDEFEQGQCDLLEQAKLSSSVWADLLGAALSEVNWHEIAGHYIEQVDKGEEAA